MAKPVFTKEQEEWIRKELQVKAPFIVLEELNNKYGIMYTASQFKSWRSNHKAYSPVRENPYKGTCSVFTKEQEAFILDNYLKYDSRVIANKLNELYGTSFTKNQVRAYRHNRKLYSELTGAFSKERPNPHKGEKGWYVKNSEATRFNNCPEHMLDKTLPLLTVVQRPGAGNYKFIKVAENTWDMYHRYLWEQENGPLKEGEKLKFLNGDVSDCRLENLMVIDNRINGKCVGGRKGNKRYFNDPELTKAGILLSKLEIAVKEKTGDKNGN